MSVDFKIKYSVVGTNTDVKIDVYQGSGSPYVRSSLLDTITEQFSGVKTYAELQINYADELTGYGTPEYQDVNNLILLEDTTGLLLEDGKTFAKE
jgi:hypothetical protein